MNGILDNIQFKIFGESHGECVGITGTGLPKDTEIDFETLQKFVDRRRAKKSAYSTTRIEGDVIEITSGYENGRLTGGEFTAITKNSCQNSSHYDKLALIPRPSHADYPAIMRFGEGVDLRGGGRFSGRLTFGLCVLGGIAAQIIRKKGIETAAYISQIGNIKSISYLDKMPTLEEITGAGDDLRLILNKDKILDYIERVRREGDSVGGVIECIGYNIPSGMGDTLDSSIESKLSAMLYAVPAVKGVEFGAGFSIAEMQGSTANDSYYFDGGIVKTHTNHNGGITGGMTNGMPILVRIAIKPTPSISKEQDSVNLKTGENVKLKIEGRHDACIVPRAVVCAEACMNIVLLDVLLTRNKTEN